MTTQKNGGKRRVFCTQLHKIFTDIDTLERILVRYPNNGDLAIFNFWMKVDKYDVAIENAGVDHTVSNTMENDIGFDVGRGKDRFI